MARRQNQGKRPRGVRKRSQEPVRRSSRLSFLHKQIQSKDRKTEQNHLYLSPAGTNFREEACYLLLAILNRETNSKVKDYPQAKHQKQKRSREAEDSFHIPAERIVKRPRMSLAAVENIPIQKSASNGYEQNINPIDYWRKEERWPKEYFETESNMSHLLARKKLTSSLHRKPSTASFVASPAISSDQKPREEKSTSYENARYETLLETKSSFMKESELGITNASKRSCQTLLKAEQRVPKNSLFRDDLFKKICEKVQDRNEAMVIQDITRLIVPSAENLAICGDEHLKILIESVSEDWDNTISITKSPPQPDYSVGFRRGAFTHDQLQRLQPFVGDLSDTSYFMATFYIATALDIADRQNAHSATIGVRATVELFKLVKREKEINREILAFSISHDHTAVRIYGHYAVLEGKKTNFYRHSIHKFDFTALDAKEKCL
ncbi:hypothetical protein AJ78_05296 [Emergomyces pasteurianus Ep9510]|uniref:DUF7924 domain-containing protein n=1 Tax=Emergomyces pasteurianus Ep9510 TaxID=1447872 RepID=A0A1J9PCW5_9EURO|nr:hypothetical protein AJ78_05296 [Emergomyces pasteurianus Ep9510]